MGVGVGVGEGVGVGLGADVGEGGGTGFDGSRGVGVGEGVGVAVFDSGPTELVAWVVGGPTTVLVGLGQINTRTNLSESMRNQ